MALPGTSITVAYVASDGQSLHFFCSPVGQPTTPAKILSVASNPTLWVSGVSVPLEGPWGISAKSNTPFVTYRLLTPITPHDLVINYDAMPGWLTTVFGPAIGAASVAVINSTGQSEPPVYGFSPFDLPLSQRKLKVGVNWAWPTHAAGSLVQTTANWLKRSDNPWKGALTSTIDGRPLTFKGSIFTPIASAGNLNYVDNTLSPTPTGVWTFIADQLSPTNPLIPSLTTNANGTVTPYPSSAFNVWQWDVQKKVGAKNNLALTLNIKSTLGGIVPYTLGNECLFGPQETASALPGNPSRVDPNRPDAQIRQWLTGSTGKHAAVIRQMDSCFRYKGVSNVVDASDLPTEEEYAWAGKPLDVGDPRSRTINIVEARTYAPSNFGFPAAWGVTWTSPDVMLNAPDMGTYHPTNPGWLNFSGAASTMWVVVEYRTDKPHGLKANQNLRFLSGDATYLVSNGLTASVAAGFGGMPDIPIFPTGADTFACTYFHGKITPGSGAALPGGLNNAIGSTAVNYAVALRPDAGVTPTEVSAKAVSSFPGTQGWANIPAGATDACSAELARRWRDNLAPGGELVVEWANECWNFSEPKIYLYALKGLGLLPPGIPGGVTEAYVHWSSHHHKIWTDVFDQADRGSEIVRYFNVQGVAGGFITGVVNEANRYNATNPLSPIRIDAIGPAPYQDMPQDMTVPIASLVSGNPLSIRAGQPTTWTRPAILDWWRHWIRYNVAWNGPTGVWAVQQQIIRTYNPVAGQSAGYVPRLICYEGGLSAFVPQPIATGPDANGCYLQAQVAHDLEADPAIAGCMHAFFQSLDDGGVESVAIYSMCMPSFGTGNMVGCTHWGLVKWPGQQAGPGLTNKFWQDTGAFQPFNESPRLKVFQEWIDATSPGPPMPPPIPITPTILWMDPADIIEGTPLNSTQLNASVAGDIPGTFAYTPPLGSILAVGQHVLSTVFTPTNHVKYTTASDSVMLTVVAAPPPPLINPVISWSQPTAIIVGAPLGNAQLNATADVPGSFIYNPPAGTYLSEGVNQVLTLAFTPDDPDTYATGVLATHIDVLPVPGPPPLPPLGPISDSQRRLLSDWLLGV